MSHRSKPYDFTNIDDLKEIFTMTVAEYIDYLNYSMTILDVEERFDESLEYFTWISLHDSNVEGDDLAQITASYLRKSGDYLKYISNRAEEKCKDLLQIILRMTPDIIVAVLGKKYIYDEEAIESVFEDSFDIKDTYDVYELKDAFIEVLDKNLHVEK